MHHCTPEGTNIEGRKKKKEGRKERRGRKGNKERRKGRKMERGREGGEKEGRAGRLIKFSCNRHCN